MGTGSPLVGRDHARAALTLALDQARSGSGRLVVVVGEPGIGKSAVLAWLAARAEPECAVLRGFCWEGDGAPPYWPWSQVLRAGGLAASDLGEAGRLLQARDEPRDAAADAQFGLMESVAHGLGTLADQQPVVVIIDDLHWADERSLHLLAFVARALASRPVLLVGAYRDTEAPDRLRELGSTAVHLPLFGLSLDEVRAMVAALPGATPPPDVVAEVWRRTGGNPFFVGELTRLLQAQGRWQPSPQLPAGVIETVRRRLARLPTDCVRLLEWAAVAGREIDIPLLVAAGAASDEIAADELLSMAVRAGMVTPTRFSHDLYRDAILEGMTKATRRDADLRVGRALAVQDRPGTAARIAAHLVRAGPEARAEALPAVLRAAREATARLGHEDAARHYEQALEIVNDDERGGVLLDLAAALDRAGHSAQARVRYRQVAELARRRSDWELLGRAALGSQGLGARSGTQDAAIARMLREAEEYLAATDASPVLRSQLLAALTHMARHGSAAEPRRDMVATAERAVELAESAGDPTASAAAQLALHDALWAPGSAEVRLPVIAAMLAASDDPELVARAHLLRATAMLELGDPAGLDELLTYVAQAEALGHGRGRWGALTRRATYAQIAGQVDDAVRLGEQALELGLAIGEPDTIGAFCTHRWSLVALGADEGEQPLDAADPLWPLFPLFRAWAPAARGQAAEARAALGDFSVQVIAGSYDLEREAIAAAVFAVAGTDAQRRWAYDQLAPYTGLHVVVSGAVAYHAAVDHHLGTLAAALGDTVAAERHHRAALAQHHKLGAAGWARISEQALAALSVDEQPRHEFRRGDDGGWLLTFDDLTTTLPDAKGLHDLRAIIAAGGREVHVLDLAGGDRRFGADEVLDDQARAAYRARIAVLDEHIEDAEARGDADRSDDLRAERTAIIRELAAATGLSGRSRRLGDSAERARKTVSARVRDILTKIDQVHPALATHLRTSLRMGTTCTYHPTHPVSWNLIDHAPAPLS